MQNAHLKRAGLLLLPLALTACPAPAPPNIAPTLQPLGAALGPAWTIVPLPNTKLTPGAIVQINPLDAPAIAQAKTVDIVWLGTLATCGVPDTVLAVTPGDVPGISAGTSYALNADISAKLGPASLDAGANATSTAQLKIDASTDTSLNYVSFSAWVADADNAKAFNAKCRTLLAGANTFVVQEAFVISKGSYSFAKNTGGKLAVTPPPNIPVKAEVDANGGPTGDLTITQPIVFALKAMQELPEGGFRVATALHPHTAVRHGHGPVAVAAGAPPPPPPPAVPPESPLAGKTVQAVQRLPGN